MNMCFILIVVMVLCMYTYVKQIIHFKYMWFIVYKFYNKLKLF